MAPLPLITMAVAASSGVQASLLNIYWLDPNVTEARCMDGSRYGYYFKAAVDPASAYKWVLELEGGGWCYNEGACYGRTLSSYSGGRFGSSKNWSEVHPTYFNDVGSAAWNRVFLRYCSGASFTGYRKEGWDASEYPVVPGHHGKVPAGTKLWFRGVANIADTIVALKRAKRMTVVDELIVQGSSAGGLATTLNVDRISHLTGAKRATGLSDAGFFKYQHNHSTAPYFDPSANFSADMQYASPLNFAQVEATRCTPSRSARSSKLYSICRHRERDILMSCTRLHRYLVSFHRYVYSMFNVSGSLSKDCRAAQNAGRGSGPVPEVGGNEKPPAGEWNCLFAATAAEYVKTPMFFLQSKFDHFQLGEELGLRCMVEQTYRPPWKNVTCSKSEIATLRAYGADLAAEASRVVAAPSSRRGVYLSACVVHGQVGDAWTTTKVGNSTPQEAWSAW